MCLIVIISREDILHLDNRYKFLEDVPENYD